MKTPKAPRAYPPIEPEQEPVAWMTHTNDLQPLFHKTRASALVWQSQPTPLYTAPPKREWIDCPPCKHACDALWECADPKTCVHVSPLISDRLISWAMLAICIALAIFALVGWL